MFYHLFGRSVVNEPIAVINPAVEIHDHEDKVMTYKPHINFIIWGTDCKVVKTYVNFEILLLTRFTL